MLRKLFKHQFLKHYNMLENYIGEIVVILLAAFAGYNLGRIYKHRKKSNLKKK